MNPGFPQTFVSIDITYAAQHTLIEEKSFDTRASRANSLRKFPFAHFEGIDAKSGEFLVEGFSSKVGHAAKPACIRVAQLAAVIEQHAHVSVLFPGVYNVERSDVASHTQTHKKSSGFMICRG